MTGPKRILLVGATGRVGRMVWHHMKAAPSPDVTVIAQHRDPDRRDGLRWDLATPSDNALMGHEFDAVISLAGVTPGRGADLSHNTMLAEQVLEAAERAGIARVLIASSSAVYGAGDGTPFVEGDALSPVNAYGAAKVAMERACIRTTISQVCCLRIGNVAGADALLLNVARAAPGMPVDVHSFADGRGPARSYIGAKTLADALRALAVTDAPLPPALNFAAPGIVHMEDLAHAAGHPVRLAPAPDGARQHITLDCSHLARLYRFASDAADPAAMVAQWKETLPQ